MRVIQIAQYADDLDRAADFYSALFEAEPAATFDPPGLLFYTLDGTRLLLDRGAPSALHYYAVADIDATVARLRESGVSVESEPHVIFTHDSDTLGPAGAAEWHAFVRDSEGNLVGLIEQRLP
jgi:methylmalonyl-CoA/ethylmalonyl-CoA epimerase